MEPVRVISGRAVPLDRSDVDTDQIIPSDWLKQVERTGFDKGLFSEWRDDRDFVLNDESYLVVGVLPAARSFPSPRGRRRTVPRPVRRRHDCGWRLARNIFSFTPIKELSNNSGDRTFQNRTFCVIAVSRRKRAGNK